MKKLAILFLALFILGMPLVASAARVSAQKTESIYVLDEGDNFDGNLWRAASNVTIDGKVAGDLFVAGNKVTINGIIEGSIFAAAADIVIGDGAKIFGNAYLAASTIRFSGDVEGNVYAFGSSFESSDKAFVKRDLYAFGSTVTVHGWVERDLRSSAQTAIIKANIGRDAQFYNVTGLHLENDTNIEGSLIYRSDNDAQIGENVKVNRVEKQKPITTTAEQEKQQRENSIVAWILSAIYGLIAFLLVALLIVIFFPNKIKAISESIAQKFGMNLLTGLVVLIVVPIISLILFCTLVGIPVAIILLVFYAVILYVGKLFVGIIAGKYIIDKFCPKWSEKTRLIIGTLKGAGIIYILTLIPILGGIIGFLATLLALGAIWTERSRFDFVGPEVKAKK
ncbi:MAG: polymer-forming cytoskeletal protein [Candidatus Berkelbacteria bacterium]|nr:polymer-forming cytoskeletal protein [Candidatus Berkelbacteria bacterium]